MSEFCMDASNCCPSTPYLPSCSSDGSSIVSRTVKLFGNAGKLPKSKILPTLRSQPKRFESEHKQPVSVQNQKVTECETNKVVRQDIRSAGVSSFKSCDWWTYGRLVETLNCLDRQDVQTNIALITSLLRACGNSEALAEGRRVHNHIILHRHERDRFVGNMVVEMYGKCGALRDARSVFDAMPRRNLFSWNIMIAAYAQNSKSHDAFCLFQIMQREGVEPDKYTLSAALDACSNVANLAEGKAIHAKVSEIDLASEVVVGTAIVNMYAKCGNPDAARIAFDKIDNRDITSWTTMITAYVQHGQDREALQLYRQLLLQDGMRPDKFTFSAILMACTNLSALADGKAIHSSIIASGFESDVVVGTALVNMYGKSRCVKEAQGAFDKIYSQNVASWNAIIATYIQAGQGKRAFQLLREMQVEGVRPDEITFVSLLGVCSDLSDLQQGNLIHANVVKNGCSSDVAVGTALVSMYGNCGNLDEAQRIFNKLSYQDVVSWNAMIMVHAQHGHSKETFQLLPKMEQNGVKPDGATFVSLLSACSHAGLLVEGYGYFKSMTENSGIPRTIEHYGCMVDLLGRAGQLEQVELLIHTMPFPPNAVMWEILLAASRVHGDIERGERFAKHVIVAYRFEYQFS